MSNSIQFTQDNFDQQVLASQQPVLVDFWAAWCGPCRLVSPTIDALSDKVNGQAIVGKLNIDENPAIAERYGISSIPTVLVFRDGEVVEKLVGVHSEHDYQSALEQVSA